MITYPFNHSFAFENKNYEIHISEGKAIIKLGFNTEKELYEQYTFGSMTASDKQSSLMVQIYHEFTTSTGTVITSDLVSFKEINGAELSAFDNRYGQMLRCHFVNGIAEFMGLPTLFNSETFEVNVIE